MKKTNKIIPLDVRGTTKAAPELTSQELEALQYMKKCGKLDMVNVQKQADMIIFKHEPVENQRTEV